MKPRTNGVIRVSEAANLAIHVAGLLARADGLTRTSELARSLGASEAHLAKVLQRLERHGIVEGVRGPSGGFRLARPAAATTLMDVYEAVEGRTGKGRCVFGISTCDGEVCTLGEYFQKVNRDILSRLASTRLSDMKIKLGARHGKA